MSLFGYFAVAHWTYIDWSVDKCCWTAAAATVLFVFMVSVFYSKQLHTLSCDYSQSRYMRMMMGLHFCMLRIQLPPAYVMPRIICVINSIYFVNWMIRAICCSGCCFWCIYSSAALCWELSLLHFTQQIMSIYLSWHVQCFYDSKRLLSNTVMHK